MLVMTLVGKEGSLGTLQSAGGVLSAILLYILGRTTAPQTPHLPVPWDCRCLPSARRPTPRSLTSWVCCSSCCCSFLAGRWPTLPISPSRCWSSTKCRRSSGATRTPTFSTRNSASTLAVSPVSCCSSSWLTKSLTRSRLLRALIVTLANCRHPGSPNDSQGLCPAGPLPAGSLATAEVEMSDAGR